MDIHEILTYLPHRYPFLLVDRVLSCEPGKTITAVKNVTINEPFFEGHFPHFPVMPGVLIIEDRKLPDLLVARHVYYRQPEALPAQAKISGLYVWPWYRPWWPGRWPI